MTPRPVVAAAIVDDLAHPTRLLCAARAYPAEVRGLFELPGGKIEDGEEPLAALRREIREELGCDLVLGPEVPAPDGGWWPILQGRRMGVWLAQVDEGGAARPGEDHLELRWVRIEDLEDIEWIVHDLPIAQEVARACRANPTLP